ncbi:hypothetical protein [Arcobacter sp. CECT 8985]|uniref:hypothetical protein n=1 Tax=Arcobacter sp. CECT 8985 TaxID=1935424 RepID=UPI00100A42C1|nr:hypothetical protein [Arcobacter sp. CECT 8985]RXJ88032.1 hypothetical protein CRU93_00075 [Arcobacter sp. CECT 8985]
MNKILYIFIALFISAISYGVYKEVTKVKTKIIRLDCQKKTTTFEKLYDNQQLKKAQKLLFNNSYNLITQIEYSKYMKSKLINHFSKDNFIKIINNSIKEQIKSQKKPTEQKLTIKAYLYENDKKDINKKSAKSKLFEGYVLIEFILNNKTLYKIQTDYMNNSSTDIKQRIDCAIKSFITLNSH